MRIVGSTNRCFQLSLLAGRVTPVTQRRSLEESQSLEAGWAEWCPSPQGVHILIPRTCDYFILDDRRDFADVIKLRILSWRDYAGLSKWAQYNHQDPWKWKREAGESEEMWWQKWDQNDALLALQVEPQAKECNQPLEVGKADGFSSSISQRTITMWCWF